MSTFKVFSSWQNKLTDRLFVGNSINNDIVILAMDDKSVNAKSKGIDITNRKNVAKVFENLVKLKPKVVVLDYDYLFPTKGLSDEELTELGEQILVNNLESNAILNKLVKYKKSPHPTDAMLAEALSKIDNLVMAVYPNDVRNIQEGILKKDSLIKSMPVFQQYATLEGNVSVEHDGNDSLVRKYFTSIETEEGDKIESLAVAAARLYGGPYVDKIPVVDENNRMYINYFGAPGAYTRVSAIDAFDGKLKKEDIEGKIVLFGATSAIFNDLEHTPISPDEQMPGVEIHANALQTILDGKFLVDASAFMKIGLIVLITGVAVFAFMYSSIRVAIAAVILLWISYYFGNKVAFGNGIILDQMYPYFAIILSLVTVFIYRFFTESKEKTFIASAFGSYVSPDVLAEIIKDPTKLALGGEEKIVTVLFSDIKDSTTISENMSAHGLVELLNEYFTVMSDIVINNGGTVDKFEGDAVMAVFGAPLSDPNHASLACRAAIEMQNKLVGLREKWKTEGKPEIFVRIGINSGPVVAGNVGSKDRFDYTVMGDTVNLGSRLEGANKQYGTEIMIGKNTADLIENSEFKDMFTLRYLDKITVKGKTQAVEVFELKGAELTE
ncbi:MAG: adenylate/guanylate cyclase domain-containing protein [Candidatus Gracilibacteria bacterium]|nr:adenylate/guanylate cyclase domain-containing protein [Candidatus Gracilibacteria bacterium]